MLGTLLLQSCSTTDYGSYFSDYEKNYKKQVDYRNHSVPRLGFRLYAREYGVRDNRPTFVLMHGFPDSLHLYDRLAPLLAENRHVIAFDFLGWGNSDKPVNHDYDVASQRRDLEAVLTYFGLKQPILVVHDASGQPGLDWALDNPDRVAALVLFNTYYGPTPTLKAPEAIARFSTPGLRRDISVWMTSHFDSLWLNGYRKQIARFISTPELRETFQNILGHQSLAIRPAFYALNRRLPDEVEKRRMKTAHLASFPRPVRIIFGNDDPYLNAGVAKELHKQFPDSELFLLKNAGHFVQIDKAHKVAALLHDFPRQSGSKNETH
ncbi:alpha/beta fold hydrolase [Thiolapillus sp.]